MPERFIDEGHPIYEFVIQAIDVQCPNCGERARLSPWGVEEPELHSPRRLACDSCGFTKDADGDVLAFYPDGRDPAFGHWLWYRIETSKGVLWAYHREHLALLEAYVSADHRQQADNPSWRNRSYFSRLPRWIKSAGNRKQVLRLIDRMSSRDSH